MAAVEPPGQCPCLGHPGGELVDMTRPVTATSLHTTRPHVAAPTAGPSRLPPLPRHRPFRPPHNRHVMPRRPPHLLALSPATPLPRPHCHVITGRQQQRRERRRQLVPRHGRTSQQQATRGGTKEE